MKIPVKEKKKSGFGQRRDPQTVNNMVGRTVVFWLCRL